MYDITHIYSEQKKEVEKVVNDIGADNIKVAFITMYIDVRSPQWKGQLWTNRAVFDDLDHTDDGKVISYSEDVKRAISVLFCEFWKEYEGYLESYDLKIQDINFVEVRTETTIENKKGISTKPYAAVEYHDLQTLINEIDANCFVRMI